MTSHRTNPSRRLDHRLLPLLILLLVSSKASCAESVLELRPSGRAAMGPDATAIRWIEPNMRSHGTERQVLESWRRGVGSPLIIAAPEGIQGAKALDSFAILSWNTHVGGGDLDRFIDDLRDGKLTDGEAVHDFVLLLQEVFRQGPTVPHPMPSDALAGSYVGCCLPSGKRTDIWETARRRGLALYYVPSMRNGGPNETDTPEDRGNAILSTMAMSSFTAVELPSERQRRLAIGASICGENSGGVPWKIQIISVHLENRARWFRWFESFGSVRVRQVTALVNAYAGSSPTVLGGDFNTWFRQWKEPAIKEVQRFFDRPILLSRRGTVRLGRLLPERMVDYLFFRLPEDWTANYQRVDKRYGSDHYPLLGRVQIGDCRDLSR